MPSEVSLAEIEEEKATVSSPIHQTGSEKALTWTFVRQKFRSTLIDHSYTQALTLDPLERVLQRFIRSRTVYKRPGDEPFSMADMCLVDTEKRGPSRTVPSDTTPVLLIALTPRRS